MAAALSGGVGMALGESLAMIMPLSVTFLLGGIDTRPACPLVGGPQGENRALVRAAMTTSKDVVSLVGEIALEDLSAVASGVCSLEWLWVGWQ